MKDIYLRRIPTAARPGKAFTVINGSNELLFGLKKFNSSAEIQTGEFKVVGALTEQERSKD